MNNITKDHFLMICQTGVPFLDDPVEIYIISFQVQLLFLVAGQTREKGLFNVYIFQQPIALSKTGRFQNNSADERKGGKVHIRVSLV